MIGVDAGCWFRFKHTLTSAVAGAPESSIMPTLPTRQADQAVARDFCVMEGAGEIQLIEVFLPFQTLGSGTHDSPESKSQDFYSDLSAGSNHC